MDKPAPDLPATDNPAPGAGRADDRADAIRARHNPGGVVRNNCPVRTGNFARVLFFKNNIFIFTLYNNNKGKKLTNKRLPKYDVVQDRHSDDYITSLYANIMWESSPWDWPCV